MDEQVVLLPTVLFLKPVLVKVSCKSSAYPSSAGWLEDISLFTLNLSIRGGTNDSVAGGAGSQL